MRRVVLPLILCAPLWLAGCDMLGIEAASAVAARKEADGKAVGGGCRYAARAIEECFEQNKKADKAAVFAGWREMNDYMRENKIDTAPARPGTDTETAAKSTDKASAKAAAPERKKES